ncbi:MAG: cupin domain-containing protein [Pseudomonadales bacterium]|nr:cupin domain-containing protein [Pseudomonadales bacterium]
MLNMDFTETVQLSALDMDWVNSPSPGVLRKPLAREDAERGHATSVVCYEPESSFRPHDHPKGEEILVIEGVFSDETGDYGAGSYFRNPAGFKHAPFSKPGCIIFVKLHQFQASDTEHVCIETSQAKWSTELGRSKLLLHEHGTESVALYKVDVGEDLVIEDKGGIEIFIVSGQLSKGGRALGKFTWLRSAESSVILSAQSDALVWVKTGHFPT